MYRREGGGGGGGFLRRRKCKFDYFSMLRVLAIVSQVNY